MNDDLKQIQFLRLKRVRRRWTLPRMPSKTPTATNTLHFETGETEGPLVGCVTRGR